MFNSTMFIDKDSHAFREEMSHSVLICAISMCNFTLSVRE
jgi:hypothetical protein